MAMVMGAWGKHVRIVCTGQQKHWPRVRGVRGSHHAYLSLGVSAESSNISTPSALSSAPLSVLVLPATAGPPRLSWMQKTCEWPGMVSLHGRTCGRMRVGRERRHAGEGGAERERWERG